MSHITDTVNFRDWVLGKGEFSEENLRKARKEFFTKLGKHWSELMQASIEKAFSDLDAVPEAIASPSESSVPLGNGGGCGGTDKPVTLPAMGTGNTPPSHTTPGEGSVQGEGTVGERLVERLSITQEMLDDNEKLRAEIARLRLSDEERDALEFAVETGRVATHDTAILRVLLERLK